MSVNSRKRRSAFRKRYARCEMAIRLIARNGVTLGQALGVPEASVLGYFTSIRWRRLRV